MKLNGHAKFEIALATVLLLSSCKLDDEQRDEVADIADDVAYDTVLEHDRIDDLESRVTELESRLGY